MLTVLTVTFQCPNSFCIPFRLVCDGVRDCEGGTDEMLCHDLLYPGFLRCKGEVFCVHPSEVCDGEINCPKYADDEAYYEFTVCPAHCTCFGAAVKCQNILIKMKLEFGQNGPPTLRKLILSTTRFSLDPNMFSQFPGLVFLDISNTGLTRLCRINSIEDHF